MSKPMVKCPICNKLFEVCRSCSENKVNSWKTVTDTEECFNVFVILHRVYVTEKMTKDEAKEKLLTIEFEDLSTYPRHIQEQICEITGLKLPETKEEVKVETKEEVKAEVETIVTEKTETVAKSTDKATPKKAYSALKK